VPPTSLLLVKDITVKRVTNVGDDAAPPDGLRALVKILRQRCGLEQARPMNLPFAGWGRLTVQHASRRAGGVSGRFPARDSAKHRIGNLTLVAQPLKPKLSNAPYLFPEEQAAELGKLLCQVLSAPGHVHQWSAYQGARWEFLEESTVRPGTQTMLLSGRQDVAEVMTVISVLAFSDAIAEFGRYVARHWRVNRMATS
jgi:hypothetical protein